MLVDEVTEETSLERAGGVHGWWRGTPRMALVSDLPVETRGPNTLQPH